MEIITVNVGGVYKKFYGDFIVSMDLYDIGKSKLKLYRVIGGYRVVEDRGYSASVSKRLSKNKLQELYPVLCDRAGMPVIEWLD